MRFERVLPLLSDVHVVVPALPGFPFAAPLTTAGVSVNRIAEIVADALDGLGYSRYTVSGGDVGGMVAEILAANTRIEWQPCTSRISPRRVRSPPTRRSSRPTRRLPRPCGAMVPDRGWIHRGAVDAAEHARRRPRRLTRRPRGVDRRETRVLVRRSAFTPDELLTWVTAYWVTGTIGTSFATYTEPVTLPDRIDTPTVLSVFPHDIKPEPRSYAEAFLNISDYVEHSAGGHFAAWEQPAAYVNDLRRAIELGG